MSNHYKHILLALELIPESDDYLIRRTQNVLEDHQSKLTMIHAVEYSNNYGVAYGVMAGVDVEEALINEANQKMQALAEQMPVVRSQYLVKTGSAKQVVLEQAKASDVDLIIVGSHGRHGVALLLGSTANAILHGAHCDVLAVRIPS